MIDPQSDRAVYRQIADELRERITSRHIGPGKLLPSATRLQQEYGVARGTIRRALEVLVREGLIVVEPSYGARVREPSERTLVSVPRGARWFSRPASQDERAKHGLAEGAYVSVVMVGGLVRGVYVTDLTEFGSS